ncbi:MAG TPA: hypothetical protein QF651_06830, partial [Acidimicrobiales bacterium]|nr:hypothetical protein [Acidimicrobiales bacterium]
MCGIIAILRRPPSRDVPTAESILTLLVDATALLGGPDGPQMADRVTTAAGQIAEADRLLGGLPGLLALDRDAGLAGRITAALADLPDQIAGMEAVLERRVTTPDGSDSSDGV